MAEINKEKKHGENGADKSVTERPRKTIKHFMVANPLQHSSTHHKELVDAVTDFLCMDMQLLKAMDFKNLCILLSHVSKFPAEVISQERRYQ